jgi:hypothetical protein
MMVLVQVLMKTMVELERLDVERMIRVLIRMEYRKIREVRAPVGMAAFAKMPTE